MLYQKNFGKMQTPNVSPPYGYGSPVGLEVEELGGKFRYTSTLFTRPAGGVLLTEAIQSPTTNCNRVKIYNPAFSGLDLGTTNTANVFFGDSQGQPFQLVPFQYSDEIMVANLDEIWIRVQFATAGAGVNDDLEVFFYIID